jgi:hypothetical protein
VDQLERNLLSAGGYECLGQEVFDVSAGPAHRQLLFVGLKKLYDGLSRLGIPVFVQTWIDLIVVVRAALAPETV